MDGELPYWLKVCTALATPAIALLAGIIAWGQFVTGRSKLVYDLFDKRSAVFTDLHRPITQAVREGRADMQLFMDFARTTNRARFLFGREVLDYLDKTSNTINRLCEATSMLDEELLLDEADRQLNIKQKWDCLKELDKFSNAASLLMAPYMSMDHKLPRFRL